MIVFFLGLLAGTCVGVILMGIFAGGADNRPGAACNQNCNQGRNCTCTKSTHA